jgi:hypothetical protein
MLDSIFMYRYTATASLRLTATNLHPHKTIMRKGLVSGPDISRSPHLPPDFRHGSILHCGTITFYSKGMTASKYLLL